MPARPRREKWAARSPAARYAHLVSKIIREILALVWKTLRVVVWKWLRAFIMRGAFFAAVAVGVVALLMWLISRF